MKRLKTSRLIISGLMCIMGLILTYFTSHMFSIPGYVQSTVGISA